MCVHACAYGTVNGYQKGSTDAFHLNCAWTGGDLCGWCLPHSGSCMHAGSRQHMWAFVAAFAESAVSTNICACTNTEQAWPHQVYSYLDNIYFATLDLNGMERGVVLLMPVVNSTTFHGFVPHCHNLPQTASK